MSDKAAELHPEGEQRDSSLQAKEAVEMRVLLGEDLGTSLRAACSDEDGGKASGTIDVTDHAARNDDCSDLTDNNNDDSDDQVVKTFPQKDSSYRHIVSWLDHGNGFVIHKKKTFASEVLPVYFKATKFTSFTRKLNRWGFQRVPRGPETGAYYHKYFRRDDPSQVLQMASNSGSKYSTLPHILPGGMIPGLMTAPPAHAMGMLPFLAIPPAAAAAVLPAAVLSQPQQQALLQQQVQQMLQFQQVLQMQQQAMTTAAAAAAAVAAAAAANNSNATSQTTADASAPPDAPTPPQSQLQPPPPQPPALLGNPALLNPMVAMMMMQQQRQQQFAQVPQLLAPIAASGAVPILPSVSLPGEPSEAAGAAPPSAAPAPEDDAKAEPPRGWGGDADGNGGGGEPHDPPLSPRDAWSGSPTGEQVLSREEV